MLSSMAMAAPHEDLIKRDRLTIVVTDSGMGGLSVLADMAARAEKTRAYRELDLVFYNALFRERAGYNSLATRDEKVRIFNLALEDMAARYQPDAIVVACNTLSVLLPDCAVAQRGNPPVFGIVEPGVEMIVEALERSPEAKAVLFATQTTVDEESHRRGLLAAGIAPERIVMQACPGLTYYIEHDPAGLETELMITSFVADALGQMGGAPAPVYISFNCTHYGYATPIWEEQVREAGVTLLGSLNPNDRMADDFFPESIANRHESTTVRVRVVSMVPIDAEVVTALGAVLRETSAGAAAALEKWQHEPSLFQWQAPEEPTGGD
jgi:glutamate racemase